MQENSREATGVMQVSDGGGSSGGGENPSDFRHILKAEPGGFLDGLGCSVGKERGPGKSGVAIN